MKTTLITRAGILFLGLTGFVLSSTAALAATSNLGETSEVLFCNGGTAP